MAIDLEALRQKHEELSGNKSDQNFLNNFLRLEEGTNLVRILPWKDDENQFYAETKIHRVEMSDGSNRNFHCRKVHAEACPLCDAYFKLWKMSSDKEDEYYMNVVVRDSEDEQRVKILSVGQIIFKKIISTMLDEDFGDITDLQTGHDYKIVKIMDGPWPKYDQSQPRPKSEPAGSNPDIAGWMETLHEIHDLVRLEEYDNVKEAAEGVIPSDDRPVESSGEEEDNEYMDKIKG